MFNRGTCGSAEHVSRRGFLSGATTGAVSALGFSGMTKVAGANELRSQQKRVVLFWLAGGVSQLETWDPKPGTDTGGPFLDIPTSVPGVNVCELLPYTARQMHHLAVVRGVNTKVNDHGKGAYFMQTGHPQTPGFEFPYLGSALSSLLVRPDNPLPGYVCIGGGGSAKESSFLGPRFVPVAVADKPPANMRIADGLTAEEDARRRELRARIGDRFAKGRRAATTEVYDESFDQAAALIAQRDVFDFTGIPDSEVDRYGGGEFARHCLMARQLVEAGSTFTKVTHRNYDTHSENFNFHVEQLGEFDQPFATFVADLADRGLLEHTLVVVMCEFGRTPRINQKMGRDHWGTAWSVALGGMGIQGGAVVGATNANGTKVVDREVHGGHLFHTYYRAVGLDPTADFVHDGRPFTKAKAGSEAIEEILA